MKLFGMCINWKVVATVAAIVVGFFVFTPKLAATALPLLVVAICPLSMLLAMGLMGRMNGGGNSTLNTSTSNEGNQMRVLLNTSAEITKKLSIDQHEQLAQLKAQQQELADKITVLEQRSPQLRLPNQMLIYNIEMP